MAAYPDREQGQQVTLLPEARHKETLAETLVLPGLIMVLEEAVVLSGAGGNGTLSNRRVAVAQRQLHLFQVPLFLMLREVGVEHTAAETAAEHQDLVYRELAEMEAHATQIRHRGMERQTVAAAVAESAQIFPATQTIAAATAALA
jgi:hypothetical protein